MTRSATAGKRTVRDAGTGNGSGDPTVPITLNVIPAANAAELVPFGPLTRSQLMPAVARNASEPVAAIVDPKVAPALAASVLVPVAVATGPNAMSSVQRSAAAPMLQSK